MNRVYKSVACEGYSKMGDRPSGFFVLDWNTEHRYTGTQNLPSTHQRNPAERESGVNASQLDHSSGARAARQRILLPHHTIPYHTIPYHMQTRFTVKIPQSPRHLLNAAGSDKTETCARRSFSVDARIYLTEIPFIPTMNAVVSFRACKVAGLIL